MKARVRRPGLERRGDRLGGAAAQLAVGRLQPAQRDVERSSSPSSIDTRIAATSSPNSRPRRSGGDRLLGQDLLLGLGEQVGAVAAGAAQVVAAELEPRRVEQLLGLLVVERGPLELEEQELGLDLGGALLDALQQRAPLGIGGVGGEAQRGVRAGTADQVVDLRQLVHRLGQAAGIELGHRPA